MRPIASVLIFLLLTACASHPYPKAIASQSAKLGAIFTLTPGEQTAIDGEQLTVKFISVINDSRCPQGAQCGWEGDAIMEVELTKAGHEPLKARLHTIRRKDAPGDVLYQGYRLQLLDLTPYPQAGSPKAAPDKMKLVVLKQ